MDIQFLIELSNSDLLARIQHLAQNERRTTAALVAPGMGLPEAIQRLLEGLGDGLARQTLLGVTGSGKTFTVANLIAAIDKLRAYVNDAHARGMKVKIYDTVRELTAYVTKAPRNSGATTNTLIIAIAVMASLAQVSPFGPEMGPR